MVNAVQDRDTVTRVNAAYSILCQVFNRLQADGADLDAICQGTYVAGGSADVLNAFAPYMNISKNCGTAGAGCFPAVTYKYLSGTNWVNLNEENTARAILSNGMLIRFWNIGGGCNHVNGTGPLTQSCTTITIDINGFKSPNTLGRDVFLFRLTKTGVFPAGSNGDTIYNTACSTAQNGSSCAVKILREGAVNY